MVPVLTVPGFVDAHSHDDRALLSDPARAVKARQGIVHQVVGNCGLTPFPLVPGAHPAYERFLATVLGPAPAGETGCFADAAAYLARTPATVTVLAGYNTLRLHRLGTRPFAAADEPAIRRELALALGAGCRGVSLGLAYLPGAAIGPDELRLIASVAPLLAVHLRSESDRLLESIEELAAAVRAAGGKCRLHLSHLKIAGRRHWPLAERVLDLVGRLHAELGVTFDHYPFAYGATGLAALLPPEDAALPAAALAAVPAAAIAARLRETGLENYLEFAGPDGLLLTGLTVHPELNDTSLAGRPVAELLRELVLTEPHPAVLVRGQSEEFIDELLRLPYGCVGTDGLPAVPAHPRLRDTFPEYLRRMRRLGLPLAFAVQKASALPRAIFGISNDATIALDPVTMMLPS